MWYVCCTSWLGIPSLPRATLSSSYNNRSEPFVWKLQCQSYPPPKTPTDRSTISAFLPCQTNNPIPTTQHKSPEFPSVPYPLSNYSSKPQRPPSTLSLHHDHPSHATSSTWQYTNSCIICVICQYLLLDRRSRKCLSSMQAFWSYQTDSLVNTLRNPHHCLHIVCVICQHLLLDRRSRVLAQIRFWTKFKPTTRYLRFLSITQYGSVKPMQCLKQRTQEDWLLFQYLCV